MDFLTVTKQLTEGFGTTLLIFIVTLVCAIPLGLVITFGSVSGIKPLRWLTRTLIWIIRGTPLMLQVIVVFYGPGLIFHTPMRNRLMAVLIAFVINYAAYFAEIYRGGITSIPRGQYEAAEVLGYSRAQTFVRIILPQMAKRVLPPVTNEVITLVKDTSLASVIGTVEMFTRAKQIAVAPHSPGMLSLAAAAVFYYIFNYLVAFAMQRIEKALDYYR